MMLEVQDEMAARFIDIKGFVAKTYPQEEVQKWLLNYLACCQEEIQEVRQELPLRKFWRKGAAEKTPDWDKVKEEMIDVLHFFMASCRILGMDAEEIMEIYMKKFEINQMRFPSTKAQ